MELVAVVETAFLEYKTNVLPLDDTSLFNRVDRHGVTFPREQSFGKAITLSINPIINYIMFLSLCQFLL